MNPIIMEEAAAVAKDEYSDNATKGIFLTSVAGVAAIISFTVAYAGTKKNNLNSLDKVTAETYDTGTKLALRALKLGTLYAFGGCGLLFIGIWKLANVNDMKEFRIKMGNMLPRIPKNEVPQSRTEFENLSDLMRYLNDDYGKDKSTCEEVRE